MAAYLEKILVASNTSSSDANNYISVISGFTGSGSNYEYAPQALRYLVVALKDANLWDKLLAIYPMFSPSGSITGSYYRNLKDARDSDDAYRLTPVSGSGSIGFFPSISPFVGGYFNTYFKPYSKNHNFHISIQIQQLTSPADNNNKVDFGCYDMNNESMVKFQYKAGGNYNGSSVPLMVSVADDPFTGPDMKKKVIPEPRSASTNGYYIYNRRTDSLLEVYYDGAKIINDTTVELKDSPNSNLGIGNLLITSGTTEFAQSTQSNGFLTFGTIGDSLSETEAHSLSTIVRQYTWSIRSTILYNWRLKGE